MTITNDIKYIGVNDHQVDLFEGQYVVPNGMAYNSYAIVDDKIAIMDTVDQHFTHEWLDNIQKTLGDRKPDFLIVQHMEPDHSGSLADFMLAYPGAVIVASAKAFSIMRAFSGSEYAERRRIVVEGDTLNLGRHALTFISAPMIHWPEVMMTYDAASKTFFSADAFGRFGALGEKDDWVCQARRYYFGIVGKYGAQVQALLKKIAALDIQRICSLHGPVLDSDLDSCLKLYDTWSSYGVESEGVMIACASIYGNTQQAAQLLRDKLLENGCPKVVLHDLARCDMFRAVEDAFRYGRIVFASSTYNADVFPAMKTFIHHLTERNFQNRTVALMENGSWATAAARVMRGMLEGCKNLTFAENSVKIASALSDESRAQIDALARELC